MAKEAKKDPQELTVEQKLKALFQLQTMLSKIDEIKTLRGELPLEVQDLEDEIAGLSTRIDRIKAEIAELKSAIAKYKEQQENVRNNREYDFLSKEIEFQTLEMELCDKRIKEFAAQEQEKSAEAAKSTEALEERQKDLDVKKNELDEIISETKQEEEKPKSLKPRLNRACFSLSSVSVRTLAMDWVSYMYSVMLVVVASTKSRPRDNWISVLVRKSSFANIADVS